MKRVKLSISVLLFFIIVTVIPKFLISAPIEFEQQRFMKITYSMHGDADLPEYNYQGWWDKIYENMLLLRDSGIEMGCRGNWAGGITLDSLKTFMERDRSGTITSLGQKKVYVPALSDSMPSVGTTFISDPNAPVADLMDIIVRFTPKTEADKDTLNNSARRLLLIYNKNYPREILGNPWDMTEDIVYQDSSYTSDVVDFENLTPAPDSISGVWEATYQSFQQFDTAAIYLNVSANNPINASQYHHLELRLYIGARNYESQPEDEGLDFGVSFQKTSGIWYRAEEIKPLCKGWVIYDWDLSSDANWSSYIKGLKLEPIMPPDTITLDYYKLGLSWVKLTRH